MKRYKYNINLPMCHNGEKLYYFLIKNRECKVKLIRGQKETFGCDGETNSIDCGDGLYIYLQAQVVYANYIHLFCNVKKLK